MASDIIGEQHNQPKIEFHRMRVIYWESIKKKQIDEKITSDKRIISKKGGRFSDERCNKTHSVIFYQTK